ncbi:MAG: putative cell division septal protein ftsq [Verrucomicrobiota bacterium]|jgi:cell division septal protein FtsQ
MSLPWFKRRPRNRRHSRGHVLEVKLSTQQRRRIQFRRFKWTLVTTLGLAALFYGGWRGGEHLLGRWVFNNEHFAISRVQVETDGVLSPEQLRSWAGVRPGANLMRLDLARVKRDLEMFPAIESVSVERVLPGTLRLRVVEREPIAQVVLAGPGGTHAARYTLDARGIFMYPVESPQRAAPAAVTVEFLPQLTGVAPPDIRPGRQCEVPQVLAALELVRAFNASAMAGTVDLRRVDVGQPGVLVVTTAQGSEVTFGLNQFDEHMRRWRLVHDHARRFSRHIERLDLVVSNNNPMQWVDSAGLSPAPTRPLRPSPYRKKHV